MTGTFLMQIIPEPLNSWTLLVLMLITAVVGYSYYIANTSFDYSEDEDEEND